MQRFTETTDEEVEEMKMKSKNANTTKSTNNWLRVLNAWFSARGLNFHEFVKLEPSVLDKYLQTFYAEVKKQNGKDYEPTSLSAMQAAIDRHLKDAGYHHSIITSRFFKESCAVLEGKAKLLREKGMGKRPNKSQSLTEAEEEMLWETGQLGRHTAQAMINTLWYQFTVHFGMRGRQEHHSMKVEDFTIKKDDEGNEFITFAEGVTKTRQSGLHEKNRLVVPKMFANNTSRCPVQLFKDYLMKRPHDLRDNGTFYLSIIHAPTSNIWYKRIPMGINTIDSIMKRMKDNSPLAEVDKKLTNHSARKTLVKRLRKAKVPPTDIIGITGHSTPAGLFDYDSGDEEMQREISLAIDRESNKQTSSNYEMGQRSVTNTVAPPIQYNFSNCNVNIYQAAEGSSKTEVTEKRRRVMIYSSESSQE